MAPSPHPPHQVFGKFFAQSKFRLDISSSSVSELKVTPTLASSSTLGLLILFIDNLWANSMHQLTSLFLCLRRNASAAARHPPLHCFRRKETTLAPPKLSVSAKMVPPWCMKIYSLPCDPCQTIPQQHSNTHCTVLSQNPGAHLAPPFTGHEGLPPPSKWPG